MTQENLVKQLALLSGETQAASLRVLKALSEVITEELKENGEVKLPGVGKFKLRDQAARTTNTSLGAIIVPKAKVAKFSFYQTFKATVKQILN